MPPSLRDWLPVDHLAWFVIETVARMDLGAFYEAYRADGHGRAAYEPAVMGRIQSVVATLNVEELRCREEPPLWIAPLQQERVPEDTHQLVVASIGSGSGRRSPEGLRALTLRARPGCCRGLASGGFVRVAGCRLSASRRCLGAICPSRSERRSRSCSLVVLGCGRSRVSWVGRRRRSPGSCSVMLRLARAGLSTGPRPRRRMRTVARDGRSRRSSRSTRSCVAMCRTGSPDRCSGRTGGLLVRRSGGGGGVTGRGRTGAGVSLGARSRSLADSGLISPMMSRCASLMRRSISRCMCRAAERCAAS